MSETAPIEYKVEIEDGVFANMVADAAVIEKMYPVGMIDEQAIYIGETVVDANGVTLTPVNGVLRFEDLPDGRRAILGNTKHTGNNCPVAQDPELEIDDCSQGCALAALKLPTSEMSRRNCARANTALTFESAGQAPLGRFMLLPTTRESYVVDGGSFVSEFNGDELMQNRLKSDMAVVFTETWLHRSGLRELTIGMNGADGSMGVATTRIDGELLVIPFCSMRQNMGDRTEQDQILRQALNVYFDERGTTQSNREALLRQAEFSITLAASASLANFAHKIKVPRETDDAPKAERDNAARLHEQYPELVQRAGNKITSAIVLNDQYPGAMERGSIFPEFEAKMGIHVTPITPDNCPGDGQTCHIDYRTETEYALTNQLQQMGVQPERVHYDDSQALDPASPENKMASNRAEQNEGVEVAKTSRTLNAIRVQL